MVMTRGGFTLFSGKLKEAEASAADADALEALRKPYRLLVKARLNKKHKTTQLPEPKM